MGLECGLVQVTPEEVHRLRRELAWYPERRPLESYSLGKVWHGLHYLLTGSADAGTPPLDLFAFAIRQLRRGAEGRHTLDPGQVKELQRALESITPDALRLRWDPDRMAGAGVYWADYFQSHPDSEYGHQLALFAAAQRYEILGAVADGSRVAVEFRWSGTLAVPAGPLPAGAEMRGRFACFLEFRDGRIVAQRNYDCFDPW